MAGGDWIKMRTDLYRDPKVCMIADYLIAQDSELSEYVSQNLQCDMSVTRNVMRNATVGALVTVWGVTRHRGKRNGVDLSLRGITLAVIDDIADLPGFGKAMCEVGWAIEKEDGVLLPRFFEDFNVEPGGDKKSAAAIRQKRYRDALRDVTSDVTEASRSDVRIEKRREENKDTPIPPEGAVETAGKAKKTKRPKTVAEACPMFQKFWHAYPYKISKPKAADAFAKHHPTEPFLAAVLAGLEKWKSSNNWQKEDGRFIPHPTTWLNQRRWEDSPDPGPIQPTNGMPVLKRARDNPDIQASYPNINKGHG